LGSGGGSLPVAHPEQLPGLPQGRSPAAGDELTGSDAPADRLRREGRIVLRLAGLAGLAVAALAGGGVHHRLLFEGVSHRTLF